MKKERPWTVIVEEMSRNTYIPPQIGLHWSGACAMGFVTHDELIAYDRVSLALSRERVERITAAAGKKRGDQGMSVKGGGEGK